jgi:hypothetical protein
MIASATTSKVGRSAGQIVLIVVGSLAGLIALVLLAGGGVLIWAHETKRDADGYYATSVERLATPTYAFVSERLDVGTNGPNWLFRRGRLGTIRVSATGASGHPVFVGIARTNRVESYLRLVAHDEVSDFEADPFSVTYARRIGSAAPATPTGLELWAVKASGVGRQTLKWPVRKGSWAVVVMNADASKGVRADVSVGARVPFLFWLTIGLLGGGVALGAGAGAAVFFGSRRASPVHAARPA